MWRRQSSPPAYFTVVLATAFAAATVFAQLPAKPDTKIADKPANQSAVRPTADKDDKPLSGLRLSLHVVQNNSL